ncbi:hypothetical protein C8F01DRAFT_5895 [Mycena amicta]|nr:hypothetical protein C8F01DRAFT_5895 [Mycena amicta]
MNPYYPEVHHRSPPPLLYPPHSAGSRSDSFQKTYAIHGLASKAGYYPASLLLVIIWTAFVGALLWLLESAVAHGPERIVQPWYYSTLPNLLLTVFAQGHAGISAMHLARVSVSALHSPRTSPNTWAEVFWISDHAWQGPWGMFTTLVSASQLGVGVSLHFVICAVTCLIALGTPVILSRAYPIQSITVNQGVTINPAALNIARMGAVDAWVLASAHGRLPCPCQTSTTPACTSRSENLATTIPTTFPSLATSRARP